MTEVFPITIAQEARLLAEEVAAMTGSAVPPNHFPITIRIWARLDRNAVTRSVRAILRHQGLAAAYVRTSRYSPSDRRLMLSLFARRGVFFPGFVGQSIATSYAAPVEWKSAQGAARPDDEMLAQLVLKEAERGPSPIDHPPLRVSVITCDDDKHLLVLVVSHISVDGWSADVIAQEVTEVLVAHASCRRPRLPQVRMHAHDFAIFEHRALRNGDLREALAYWLQQSRKSALTLVNRHQLPTWLLRKGSPSVKSVTAALDESLTAELRSVTRRSGITPYVFCRSIFALLLHGYTSQARLSLWANFANRRFAGAEVLVANCVTQHPIASELSLTDSVLDFCKHMNARLREAQRYEALSQAALPLLSDEAPVISDTRIVFDVWPRSSVAQPSAVAEPLLIPAARPWVDLDVRVQDNKNAIAIVVAFNSGRYSPDGVATIVDHLLELIRRAVSTPCQPATKLAELAGLHAGNVAPILTRHRHDEPADMAAKVLR